MHTSSSNGSVGRTRAEGEEKVSHRRNGGTREEDEEDGDSEDRNRYFDTKHNS